MAGPPPPSCGGPSPPSPRRPGWPGDQRRQVAAAGQRAERAAVLGAEAGRAERVGDRGGASAAPAASPAGRRPSGRRAGGRPPPARRCRPATPAPTRSPGRARGSSPRARPDLDQPGVEHLGLAGQRPEHVERVDVARALPDRVQRRLAEEQRHPGLLDVAVAAQALQRLGHHHRGPLADPELRQRQRDAAQRRLVRVVGAVVDGGGQPDGRARWRPRTRPRGRRPRSA